MPAVAVNLHAPIPIRQFDAVVMKTGARSMTMLRSSAAASVRAFDPQGSFKHTAMEGFGLTPGTRPPCSLAAPAPSLDVCCRRR